MIKTNKTLYDHLNMKGKNSIYKSVFITDRYTSEGYRIVEAEAYDNTFLNATNTMTKYDNTIFKIMKKVYSHFKDEDIWLIIYTEKFGRHEILVNEFYMKEFNLI